VPLVACWQLQAAKKGRSVSSSNMAGVGVQANARLKRASSAWCCCSATSSLLAICRQQVLQERVEKTQHVNVTQLSLVLLQCHLQLAGNLQTTRTGSSNIADDKVYATARLRHASSAWCCCSATSSLLAICQQPEQQEQAVVSQH
jgi:hypothetical protein